MKTLLRRTLHMTGSRRTALDIARGRIVLVSAIFVFAYITVAARAFDVSIIQGEVNRDKLSAGASDVPKTSSARRGDIVDRNGVILARSLSTASLYADPKLIADPAQVAKDLSGVFKDISYGDTLKKLQEDKRFVWIRRNLTPEEQQKILYLGHPGLSFEEEDRRIYPQGELAAHVVGFTNIDGSGLAGVEGGFNKLLTTSADPLALTIDVRLQHALRREVAAAATKHRAIGGAGIIMDVGTGEILASVSYPDFDPNITPADNDLRRFNRVTLGVYEPGSTFKIFTTAALLESGDVPMGRTFDATQPLKAGRFTINDYHAERRRMTVPEVFMHSSNIGSAMMGQAVGTKAFTDFLSDLGLMSAPKVEISEIGAPIVPKPWREINTLTASFGHGIAVSPLQLVAATSSVMNGGITVKPTYILNRGKKESETGVRVVSPETAHRMRQLMRLVVTDGTGSKADVPGYHVGGKTGTAEKNIRGKYDQNKIVSSFLGVFPAQSPKYAVYVMIDEPKATKDTYGYATGGWVAAPAVRKTIASMVSILGIKPEEAKQDLKGSLKQYVKTKEQIAAERSHENH